MSLLPQLRKFVRLDPLIMRARAIKNRDKSVFALDVGTKRVGLTQAVGRHRVIRALHCFKLYENGDELLDPTTLDEVIKIRFRGIEKTLTKLMSNGTGTNGLIVSFPSANPYDLVGTDQSAFVDNFMILLDEAAVQNGSPPKEFSHINEWGTSRKSKALTDPLFKKWRWNRDAFLNWSAKEECADSYYVLKEHSFASSPNSHDLVQLKEKKLQQSDRIEEILADALHDLQKEKERSKSPESQEHSFASSPNSHDLVQLKEKKLQQSDRIIEILADALHDLQKEKERSKSPESQLEEATRKYEELSKKTQHRDIEEENRRKKLEEEASNAVQK